MAAPPREPLPVDLPISAELSTELSGVGYIVGPRFGSTIRVRGVRDCPPENRQHDELFAIIGAEISQNLL